jgi:acylphosphatase
VLVGRRYVVKGRVQRVGFRMFVEDAARREGIQGYVRNQYDGSVEIVAEGDADAMQRFEMAVRRGPPALASMTWTRARSSRRAALRRFA